MMTSTCKRARLRLKLDACHLLNKDEIDETLRLMQESNEVINPTRRKIKRVLKSKLQLSKQCIKANKSLIDSAIEKYWIVQADAELVDNCCPETKSLTIFMLADVIQQKVFLFLHPRAIYSQIPLICKWWDHLVLKKDFLTDISHTYLQIQCPSPLTMDTLIPQLQHCCHDCGNGNVLTKTDVDMICRNGVSKLEQNEIEYIRVPFDSEYCNKCFETNEKNQAILCETAKDIFKLNNNDLAPIQQQYNPFLFSLKLYGRVSDIKKIAQDKYGDDLSILSELTPMEIGSIDRQRQHIIKMKIRKLKLMLLNDVITNQNELNNNNSDNSNNDNTDKESNSSGDYESSSDEYDASFVRYTSQEDNNNNNFENVEWPSPEMMRNARKQYETNICDKNKLKEQTMFEIETIELDDDTMKQELEIFLSSKEYNHYFGFAFFVGSHNNNNNNTKKQQKQCKDNDNTSTNTNDITTTNNNNNNELRLSVPYDEILERFECHLQRVRQRKWKIRHRSSNSWYQDWFDTTWSHDYRMRRG